MRILAVLLVWCSVIVLAGCTGYPRYRSGPVEMSSPASGSEREIEFTTAEYVRLGLILQSYLGKPYAGHSIYDPGIDCSLFTREVFQTYNKTPLPRTAEEQFRSGRPVHRDILRYGDLVFFRTVGNAISHVGVYLGYDTFIHASTSRGVIISSIGESYWAQSFAGARRILD